MPVTVSELQHQIREIRAERGFVTDPIKIMLHMTEEVGEIASELKRLWSPNYGSFDTERLREEIADVFVTLSAMANAFEIDIEEAVRRKFIDKDSTREWKSATK